MISPRWRKIIRDLWDNKSRTILVVLSIAIGVLTFGGLLITASITTKDLSAQYEAINAAHVTINIPGFDETLVNWAERQDGVAQAAGRAVYYAKLVTADNVYEITLYAYPDYEAIAINQVNPITGEWPPARGHILLEQSSWLVDKPQIDDLLTVRMPDDEEYDLVFTGQAHDISVRPSTLFPGMYGFVSFDTLADMGYPRDYNQLDIRVDEILLRDPDAAIFEPTRLSLEASGASDPTLDDLAEIVADDLQDKLQHRNIPFGAVSVPGEDGHWASDILEGIVAILVAIGFFSLLLSGFLIVNTIDGLLAQQRKQIGIMKVIGAKREQIIGIYLVLVLVLGVLALLLALPGSVALAYLLLDFVAVQYMNFDRVNFFVEPWIFILQVAAALLLPFFAALGPVLNGTNMTAYAAMSDMAQSKNNSFDQLLSMVRGLPRPMLLAIRNTFRRKARLIMTLITLALAGMLFMSVMNVRASLITEVDNLLRISNYDVQLMLKGVFGSDGVQRRAGQVPGVVFSEGWIITRAQRIRADDSRGGTFTLSGVPYNSPFVDPLLLEGRWLTEGDEYGVVMTRQLVNDEGELALGDTIEIEVNGQKHDWKLVGVIAGAFPDAYTDFSHLTRVMGVPGDASQLLVRTANDDGAFQQAVADELEDYLDERGIGIGSTITSTEITTSITSSFNILIYILLTMAVLVVLVGGLGLAGTMSLNVLERTREIGVMRAVGAADNAIRGIVMGEGVLVGFLSWGVAIPLSIPSSQVFSEVLGEIVLGYGMSYVFDPLGLLLWLAIALSIATGASLFPARRASQISVREALSYE